MELVESIEYINEQLEKLFGTEMLAGSQPKFRVVFSEDMFEKRVMTHDVHGNELLFPEVREVPKYRHYIRAKYVLERLVPVDQENTDLTTKVSYEPAHVFMRPDDSYLPPRLDMCCVAIEGLMAASEGRKPNAAKYIDPAHDPEYMSKKVESMTKELFGNETETTDALTYKEGIVNPAGQMEFHEQQKDSSVKEEKVN